MAFCTNCGAQVSGAFCNQCGARMAGPQGAVPPGPAAAPSAPPVSQPASAGAPVARRTSPIVWILVIILGLFVLGGVAVVGTGFFVYHKAKQAGLDPDLMRRNPGYAAAKLMIAANPDVEEVRHDDAAGTVTLRDRKTGKMTTWNFDDVKSGKFKITAEDENGKSATMEFGGSAAKLPSWVPNYPGSATQPTFSVKGDSSEGTGGNYSFTTKDSASKVLQFFQDKVKDLGMKVNLNTTTAEGGMIVASDDDSKRTLTVVVGGSSGETTVNVTYASKQ